MSIFIDDPDLERQLSALAAERGERLEDILGARTAVTEGVATAPAVVALARREGVDMPICQAVDAVLSGALTVDGAIDALLARPFKPETA